MTSFVMKKTHTQGKSFVNIIKYLFFRQHTYVAAFLKILPYFYLVVHVSLFHNLIGRSDSVSVKVSRCYWIFLEKKLISSTVM